VLDGPVGPLICMGTVGVVVLGKIGRCLITHLAWFWLQGISLRFDSLTRITNYPNVTLYP